MIQILQQPTFPDNVQPSYGNLVYRFDSTNQATTYKFRYIVDVYVGGVVVTRLKVTPQLAFGQVDIATIVQNYLNSRPINKGCTATTENTIVKAKWGALADDITHIQIGVGEEYASNPDDAVTVYEPTVFSNPSLTYNGVKNWYDGKEYNFSQYFLSKPAVPLSFPAGSRKFLTHAPRVQYIEDDDWYTLTGFGAIDGQYFTGSTLLNVVGARPQQILAAVFEFFDIDNNLVSSARTYNVEANCGAWQDCADVSGKTVNQPYHRFQYLGVGTKNLQEHGITLPSNWHYYRVYFEGTDYVCNEYTLTNTSPTIDTTVDFIECDGTLSVIPIGPGGSITRCGRSYGLLPSFITASIGEICTQWFGVNLCFDTSRISEYFYFYKDPTCGPGKKRIMFLNSLGTWDYFTFKYRDNVGYDMNRQTLQREPDLYSAGWNADKYYGWNATNRVYKQNITKTGLLYSGRISKSYLAWLTDELLKSPSVYIVDDAGDIQPIVLTNTEVIEPNFQRNDGEYELRLEYTGGYNETRQDKE